MERRQRPRLPIRVRVPPSLIPETFGAKKMNSTLSPEVAAKVRSFVQCNPDINVVTAVLRDGRKIANVMIHDATKIVGEEKRDFTEGDVVDVVHQPWGRPTVENEWWKPDNPDWGKK